jgi:DnaK suppressor protein
MQNDIDFGQFRRILETEKAATQQSLDLEINSFGSLSDPSPDFLDAAFTSTHQDEKIRWIGILKGRLEMIDQALQRIELGLYGKCVHCGKDIGADRLRAKPHAKYCIKCKEKKEEIER